MDLDPADYQTQTPYGNAPSPSREPGEIQPTPPVHEQPHPQDYRLAEEVEWTQQGEYNSKEHSQNFHAESSPYSSQYLTYNSRHSSSSSRQGNPIHGYGVASPSGPHNPIGGRGPRESSRIYYNNPSPEVQGLLKKIKELNREKEVAAETIAGREHHIESLKAELTKRKYMIQNLNSELTENQGYIRALESQIAQSIDNNRALKSAIADMRTGNSSMVTDSQLQKDYQFLISQLKNWTFSHFCDITPKHVKRTIADFGLNASTNTTAVEMAAAITKYLEEDTKRRFLVIGMLVMQYFDEHIFDRFVFGLTKTQEEHFNSLAKSFEKTSTPKDINFWRSSTLEMMIATEAHQKNVQEQKKDLIAQLESILVNTIPHDGDTKERIEDLQNIVNDAVNLALTLSVQRARYYLHSPLPGETLEPFIESAEDSSEDGAKESELRGSRLLNRSITQKVQKRVVELTVYPALAKRGNEDGEKYDQVVYICNAKALLKVTD